jgi:hypothetical protein
MDAGVGGGQRCGEEHAVAGDGVRVEEALCGPVEEAHCAEEGPKRWGRHGWGRRRGHRGGLFLGKQCVLVGRRLGRGLIAQGVKDAIERVDIQG